jgi:hypothetical protein
VSGGDDPFAQLAAAVQNRKLDYLRRLTTDPQTFAKDPVKNGMAKRRGFLAGHHFGHAGQRPSASRADQEQAISRQDDKHRLSSWYDDPALRSIVGDDWEGEDINLAIVRLATSDPKADFSPPFPAPDDLIPLDAPARLRQLMKVLSLVGLQNRRDVADAIGGVMKEAHPASDSGARAFADEVVEAVCDALQFGDTPSGAAPPASGVVEQVLQSLTVEGANAPLSLDQAQSIIASLAHLVPADLAERVLSAATKDQKTLSQSVWKVIGDPDAPGSFPWLAGLESMSAQGALLRLAEWRVPAMPVPVETLHPIEPPPLQLQDLKPSPADISQDSFLKQLFLSRVSVPDYFDWSKFQWPRYDISGIYWWRSVILPDCLGSMIRLADTADFHATHLLRLAGLFHLYDSDDNKRDKRIPDFVRTDVKLAFLYFKYWFDEPPGTGNDGGEMTFWSENHQIQFSQVQLLTGLLFRKETFLRPSGDPDKPRTGQAHRDVALPRLQGWLDYRLNYGFSEWRAPGYYNEDFPALFNLVDFCTEDFAPMVDDAERQVVRDLRIKATMVMDLLLFDLARFTCRGSFGVSAGRAYWEHKNYGWEQSVGETVEILTGARGDFTDTEGSAVALCTSTYDLPEALIAIARDRQVVDPSQPFVDRSRVSINFDEAGAPSTSPDNDNDMVFWWGNMAYFDHTLEATRKVVEAHPNLKKTPPFKLLYLLGDDDAFHAVLYDLLETLAGLTLEEVGSLAVLLPFPLSILGIAATGAGIEATLEGLWHLLGDIWTAVKSFVNTVENWLGLGDDDPPKIPESALQKTLEALITEFNVGSVLTRANLYTYSNGDAMLSSSANHAVTTLSFQKQPWQATLDTDACVWTTAPLRASDLSSQLNGWLNFFKDLGAFRPESALMDVFAPLPPVQQQIADQLGHDGPNYWTGSVSLPLVVQHESCLIAAYNLTGQQRMATGSATHAWFPMDQFDEVDQEDQHGGTWTFGRKGDGFVALFSARKVRWTTDGNFSQNNKELLAEGGSNIWVCLVGNTTAFAPPFRIALSPKEAASMSQPDYLAQQAFNIFKRETLDAYMNISGVGTPNELECSFDIPRAEAPRGRSPRLELFFDSRRGRFAGDDLQLDEFPRFENRYVTETTVLPEQSGLGPQVVRFGSQPRVSWGSRAYTIQHAPTGLVLTHDLDRLTRTHTHQADKSLQDRLGQRRLQNGSLTPARSTSSRPIKANVRDAIRG